MNEQKKDAALDEEALESAVGGEFKWAGSGPVALFRCPVCGREEHRIADTVSCPTCLTPMIRIKYLA